MSNNRKKEPDIRLITSAVQQQIPGHEYDELVNLRDIFYSFLRHTPDFIYIKDTGHRFTHTSDAFAHLVKADSWKELVGKTDFDIFPKEHAEVYFEKERSVITEGHRLTNLEEPYFDLDGKLRWVSSSKRPIFNDRNEIVGLFGISRDITDSKQLQQKLEDSANHDYLTGLATRRMFIEQSDQLLSLANRIEQKAVCIFIDLDNFKPINDQHGHDAGDAVLIEVANRIKENFRSSDIVCRLGGDEFLVLALVDAHSLDLEAFLRKIVSKINRKVSVEGHDINLTCSLGAALFPEHGQNVKALIRHSDVAMYRAKHAECEECFAVYHE